MTTRQATFWFSVPLLSLVFPAEALQEFVGVFTERSSVLFPALTESDRCQKEFYVFFSTSGVCFFPPLLSKDDTFQLQRGKEWDYLITVWSKFFNLLSSSCWGVHPHFSSRETDQIELVMTLSFYLFIFIRQLLFPYDISRLRLKLWHDRVTLHLLQRQLCIVERTLRPRAKQVGESNYL